MEIKKYTQFGTITVVILSVVLIISVVTALNIGLSDSISTIIFWSIALILFISLLFFYKIDIEIDRVHITFKMGIGIIGKSYDISKIESCKPVKNSVLYGWGIHKIPNGWLYNVSGLNAVELTFKTTGKKIRIGTNKPSEITDIVTGLINLTHVNTESKDTSQNYSTSKSRNIYMAVTATIIIVVLFNLYQYQPEKIYLKENQLEISGEYGFPIYYRQITVIDTFSQMPVIEMRTNGFALGKVCKGNFRLKNTGSAILFVNYNVTPFVHIALKYGKVIYFNLKNRQTTIDMFDKIKSLTKQTH